MIKLVVAVNEKIEARNVVKIVDKDIIQKLLVYLHRSRTWREISKIYKIPAGTLDAYAHGLEIKNKKHRAIFGLPDQVVLNVCPTCGIVHVKKCPHENHKKELTIEQRKINVLKRIKKAVSQAQELGLDVQWSLKL